MNTYDAAYDLAKAIKESDEMKRLTATADKVKNDADAKKMVKEYIMAQMQADYAMASAVEVGREEAVADATLMYGYALPAAWRIVVLEVVEHMVGTVSPQYDGLVQRPFR